MAGYTSPKNMIDLQKAFGMVDPNTARNNGLRDMLWQIGQGAGWNPIYLVNACDAETPVGTSKTSPWTESASGTLDAAAASADNRIATNALGLTQTIAYSATTGAAYVECRYISAGSKPTLNPDTGIYGENWEDTDYVSFWASALAADGFDTAGELKFALVNASGDGVETVGNLINVPAVTNAVHYHLELDISAETRDNVVAIRFYGYNAVAGQGIEIDYIQRYKFGNGKGPVLGNVILLPILSGQTVARGNFLQLNVPNPTGNVPGCTVQVEAAAAVNTVGLCVVGGTGVAGQTVLAAAQISGPAYLRAGTTNATSAGEYVKWATGHTVIGAGGANPEYAVAKAMEAPGADDDDYLALLTTYATIS